MSGAWSISYLLNSLTAHTAVSIAHVVLQRLGTIPDAIKLTRDGADSCCAVLLAAHVALERVEVCYLACTQMVQTLTRSRRQHYRTSLLIAAVACMIRQTNAVVWAFLFLELCWRTRSKPGLLASIVINAGVIGFVSRFALSFCRCLMRPTLIAQSLAHHCLQSTACILAAQHSRHTTSSSSIYPQSRYSTAAIHGIITSPKPFLYSAPHLFLSSSWECGRRSRATQDRRPEHFLL